MWNGACFFGAIAGALVASGILASVATGHSCAITIRWNDAVYTSVEGPLRLEGTVTQVDPLRIDVERTEVDVEEDDGEARLEVDSGTRIGGFDRDGIATLAAGDEIVVTARLCGGELVGPLADSIEPAG